MRWLVVALAVALGGCPKSDTATAGDADGAAEPLREVRLPAHWTGEGVLARQHGKLPRGAPHWARAAAEVARRDGERVLRACGHASRIKDPSLAQATAEARARDELARWLQTREIEGSRQINSWNDPETKSLFVRLEVAVPEEWVPGRPLP